MKTLEIFRTAENKCMPTIIVCSFPAFMIQIRGNSKSQQRTKRGPSVRKTYTNAWTFKNVLRRIAVGHFAAKQGSLRSPRGRLVPSLAHAQFAILPTDAFKLQISEQKDTSTCADKLKLSQTYDFLRRYSKLFKFDKFFAKIEKVIKFFLLCWPQRNPGFCSDCSRLHPRVLKRQSP